MLHASDLLVGDPAGLGFCRAAGADFPGTAIDRGGVRLTRETPKLDIGAVIEEVLQTYIRHGRPLLWGALLMLGPVSIANALLDSGDVGLGVTMAVVVISVLAGFWYGGTIVQMVTRLRSGATEVPFRASLVAVWPVLGSVIGASLLAELGIAVGLLLFLVPGMILLARWALIVPVIVVEGSAAMDSFARSNTIVRGNSWRVFAVIVFVGLLAGVTFQVLAAIGVALAGDGFIGSLIGYLPATVLTWPIFGLSLAAIYFRLADQESTPEAHIAPGLQRAPEPPGSVPPPST